METSHQNAEFHTSSVRTEQTLAVSGNTVQVTKLQVISSSSVML